MCANTPSPTTTNFYAKEWYHTMLPQEKLCECGCGRPAPIATQSSTKYGWIKGQPVRFIQGHGSKRERAIPPPPPDDESRYISLSRGAFALVDSEDYERVSQHSWHLRIAKTTTARYAAAGKRSNGIASTISMHRFVLDAKPNEQIDHIDGDGLNNRKCNLRMCTHSTNQANRQISSNNTSGYKGVSWHKGISRWVASIRQNRKRIAIGCFDSPEEAAEAYNDKAVELFGEFARLNHIERGRK